MFQKAIPVWGNYATQIEKQNRHLIFRQTVKSLSGVTLTIAAADFYRLTVNGQFVGFGPARTAKGYARVDVYDLSDIKERPEGNEICLEVAGYYCKSLSAVWQESFLCAEIAQNGVVTHYTGRDFECVENVQRVRQVERYSVQRHFGEIYDRRMGGEACTVQTIPVAADIRFIPRHVPFADCQVRACDTYLSRGVFAETADGRANSGEFGTGKKQLAYSCPPGGEGEYGIFDPDTIADKPYRYIGGCEKRKTGGSEELPLTLSAGQWLMVDFGVIETGFLRLNGRAETECDLILAFSELCEGDTFAFRKINLHAVLEYKLPAGAAISEESFEPYTFRHVAVFVKKGSVVIEQVGCRTFERNRAAAIQRTFQKPEHNEIYQAALRTFAHNAVDLLTDCPSRERAGWLCDSFFTGRAEYFLYGETPIEDAFLENYVLYQGDGSYPEGVLPMCYPSTPTEGPKFIPQWNMWYVLEVCEYLQERRPDRDKAFFEPSVMGVMNFLQRYENADGLLENLPGWNFVEWSDANSWTKDVNYPTNFLYAAVLDGVAEIFHRPEWHPKAQKVRQITRERAFNGELFVDHALKMADGSYVNQKHISEACQYYAILYGGVDLNDPAYAVLKTHVIGDFQQLDPGEYQFCPKNAFIGLYLRMNVLMQMQDGPLMAQNLESFCLHMCRTTGTLWEYKDGVGSLDHGFASYVALTIPFADA